MSALREDVIRARVERLPEEARALLAQRLGLAEEHRRGPADQLVAWVVPANAGAAPDGAALAAFLRERLPEHMVPAAFVFLDALPRLPNGKPDTSSLPDPVPSVAPDEGFVPPRTARDEALARIWAAVLGVDRIGIHDNFFELGGDSILSIQVVARAKRAGLHITPELVFRHQTLGALAAAVGEAPAASPEARLTSAPLSPVQAWFFEQPLASPHHWHQAVWLRPPADFDAQRFERAVRRLVAHHDALRLTFRRDGDTWRQQLSDGGTVSVREIAFPADGEPRRAAALQLAVDELCSRADLTRGPLVLPAVVRRPEGVIDRVLIAVHHLAVDAVSWSILLEDLRLLYEADADVPQLMRTTSFLSWCDSLRRISGGSALEADVAWWTALPRNFPPLPRENEGDFEESSALTISVSLDVEASTRLVHDVHGAYNTTVEDFLLAALGRTVARWSGGERVLVGVERHGREPLVPGADLTRTVGWLTAYFPVVLDVRAGLDAGAVLRSTKDTLRAIPNRGAGYGVLRYVRDDAVGRSLAAGPAPELIFNHAGRIDIAADSSPWTLLGPPFSSRAPDNRRAHRLEVNTYIAYGVLHVHWTAGRHQYGRGTIERLAAGYLDELRALCDHALTARTSGFTPADFPEAGLDQAELDRFLEGLGA